MKKIVGILGAAAVLATSVFAADVNARLRLGTNIFDSANKKALTAPASTGWDTNNTFIKVSTTTDNVGADIYLWDKDAAFQGLSIWIKPIDSLKITVGKSICESIARGCFAWWAKTAKIDALESGIKAEFNMDALSLEVAIYEDFLDFNKKGYDVVGTFWVAGKYNLGEAGTIQAIVTKGADLNAYGVGGWKNSAGNRSGLAIGVAYDHMPWGQTGFYGDVFVNFNNKFEFDEVAAQIGGQYCQDALAVRLTNMLAYGGDKFSYGFAAKVSYTIDTYTPYLQLVGNGILNKQLGVEVGVDKSIGICAINLNFNTTLNFTSDAKFNFTIPVTFDVSF